MHGKSYKKGGKAIETENWPKTLSAYKKTPNFTEVTVPKAFLQAHATKDGVWARLHVLEGCLTFLMMLLERRAFYHPVSIPAYFLAGSIISHLRDRSASLLNSAV